MKRRFLLDNDGSNIFHNTMREGTDLDSLVAETVQECSSEVTTYLLCSNAGTCYFPTKVSVMDPRARGLAAALEQGKDLLGMLLRAIKASGRETFVTMRVNDVHNPDAANQWNTPPIRREHPEYVVAADEIEAGKAGWMSYCLDYSRPQVRDFYLALIEELVELYGDTIDGIQLDWMRFPRHLSGVGEEVWEKREALTEFTARAREILQSAGSHLQLAARVPPTLEGCRNIGMDLAEWTKQGIVDFLVLCPFLTTNWHIPFAGFRELLGENLVPLYGGFDFGYGATVHHPESLRGICTSLYDCGADGIYLFNFPCWTEYLGARPYHWLAGLGDPDTAAAKPLQLAVAHQRHRNENTDGPAALPANVPAGESLEASIYVPTSALPAWRCMALAHSHDDITLAVNGAPATPLQFRADDHSGSDGHRSEIFLEFADQYFQKDCRPQPQDCRLFRIDPGTLSPGFNRVEVSNASDAGLEIERLELALW